MTTPSSQSLPFAIASTVGPLPRRPSATKGGGGSPPGIADSLKTLAPQAALRGEHARALDLYRTLAGLEPTVPLHRIRAGDCLVKLGQKREALSEYRVAADAYAAMGLHAHARSAWRLVLGIVPGDADATARLHALDARSRSAKAGTPPTLPVSAGAIAAPPPPHGAPGTKAARGATPTAPESELRAERAGAVAIDDSRTALSKAPEKNAVPPAPRSATPASPKRVPKPRSELALEFADLDADEDCLWIDLDGIVEPELSGGLPLEFREENGEPVAFFAETSEPGPVRQSAAVAGPPSSLIEEQTKPVPAPDL